MYEEPDRSTLRQGDVIQRLLLPRYSLGNLGLIYRFAPDDNHVFDDRGAVGMTNSLAVVLSQCCEFNQGKRQAFSVAELLPARRMGTWTLPLWGLNLAELTPLKYVMARGIDRRELVDALRRGNEIDTGAREKNTSLHLFLYDSDGAVLEEPHVADFSRVTSIRMKDMGRVRERKVLQLDEDSRAKFRMKLAYFYGRSA